MATESVAETKAMTVPISEPTCLKMGSVGKPNQQLTGASEWGEWNDGDVFY